MTTYHGDHVVRLLVGNQPARDLDVRLAREHGFAPRPLIAAVEAVDLDRWTVPLAGQRAVSGFAACGRCAYVREIARFVERQSIECLEQRRLDRDDLVVETIDGDAAALVVERCDQRRGGMQRVGDTAAVAAGMQILARAANREGERREPARTDR